MHYYGDHYRHLYLPGSSCVTETIQHYTPQHDTCPTSSTCHPLSIIKSPMPRWQSYPQPLTYICPQPSLSQAPLLSCQPYVQKCVLLYPEPCEPPHLLPCRKASVRLSTPQPCQGARPEKKRLAKSLPPCAPRCPEPSKLKFPPCGIKYSSSSSSCKEACRSQKVAKCSSQQYSSCQGMPSGYSRPLRGVTECPPQQCTSQLFLRECVGSAYPQQKCMKGYPTQEYVTTYSSQPCLTKSPPLPPPPPPPQATKCLPGQRVKEHSSHHHAAKCSLEKDGGKVKSSSTPHLSKSKCLYPRSSQHTTQRHAAGAKRSSHAKKSRCASKWLW